jgi:regulatory protein RepA
MSKQTTRPTEQAQIKEKEPEQIDYRTGYKNNVLDIISMIDNESPPVEWLFKNLLPANIIGDITAAGGTGKTFLLIEMGLAKATGTAFLRDIWMPTKAGKILCVFGEESQDELHRRLKKVIRKNDYTPDQIELIRKNFNAVSTHGTNPAFIDAQGQNSDFFEDLVDDAIRLRAELIILDPISRFFKADENDATKATVFVEKLEELKERVRHGTGENVVVLGAHHVNKSSTKADMSAGMLRGSSAFTDAVRWVLGLQKLSPEDWAGRMGLSLKPPDRPGSLRQARADPERKLYVQMERVKANYLPPQTEEEFLKIDTTKATGGTLEYTEPPLKAANFQNEAQKKSNVKYSY